MSVRIVRVALLEHALQSPQRLGRLGFDPATEHEPVEERQEPVGRRVDELALEGSAGVVRRRGVRDRPAATTFHPAVDHPPARVDALAYRPHHASPPSGHKELLRQLFSPGSSERSVAALTPYDDGCQTGQLPGVVA